ncbi:hypothetical protein [Methylomonas sp. AM2-LC]|uniref:hypothetical protein n=1 Tax=Methylomonas sp. AM2-LC TaxID=3153301 RepID=UPI003266FB34
MEELIDDNKLIASESIGTNNPAQPNRTRTQSGPVNLIERHRGFIARTEIELSPRMASYYTSFFNRSQFYASTMRRNLIIINKPDIELEILKRIDEVIQEVNDVIDGKYTVAEKLLKQNRVKLATQQLATREPNIIDPIGWKYIGTFRKAVRFEQALTTLWLTCIIDDKAFHAAMDDIRGNLRSVRNTINTFSLELRKEAMGRRDEWSRRREIRNGNAVDQAPSVDNNEENSSPSVNTNQNTEQFDESEKTSVDEAA